MAVSPAYQLYSDLEQMPRWSPWLQKVTFDAQVSPGQGCWCGPKQSCRVAQSGESAWELNTRGIRLEWEAVNTETVANELITWKSTSGVANRGQVR